MNRVIVLVALLCLTATIPTHAGKFYKWVDNNGVTHYTAKPPEDRPAETIKLKTPKPSAEVKPNSTSADPDAAQATEQDGSAVGQAPEIPIGETQTPVNKSREEAANCALARRNLETLRTRTQVRMKDPATGQYRYATGEEQIKAKAEAEAEIKRYCR